MQSTASSSSAEAAASTHNRKQQQRRHQNVTTGCNKKYANTFHNYETCSNDDISHLMTTTHLMSHRKCELNSSNSNSNNNTSESDTSTNVHHLRNKSKRNSNSRRCIVNSSERRRRKVQLSGTCMVFLVLTCLVVNLELVFGALNHYSNTKNSVNYSHDNYTTTTLLNESDNLLPFLDDVDAIYGTNEINQTSSRPQIIYQNEFAVHIFGGNKIADEIAAKHGFTNMGQVSNSYKI